jgi:deoxyribose-phosphate aldolase
MWFHLSRTILTAALQLCISADPAFIKTSALQTKVETVTQDTRVFHSPLHCTRSSYSSRWRGFCRSAKYCL